MSNSSNLLAHELVAKNGTPAVFMHALLGNRSFMQDMAVFWQENYGSSLTVDLHGHGESPMPSDAISINSSAAEVIKLMEHTGQQKSVLIGHSMGGLVALEIAAQNPDNVAGVILLDPAPIVFDAATREGWTGLLGMLQSDGFEQAKTMLIDSQSGTHDNAEAVAARREMMEQISSEALCQSFASMLNWDGASALSKITAPVLGIWGNRNNEPDILLDHKADALTGQVIASGHYIHLEAKEQVEAMIKRIMAVWGI